MKFLKKLNSHDAYTAFTNSSGFNNAIHENPVVGYCLEEKHVHFNHYVTVPDPYNGHDYVEIGGLKWATMNIGANNITDAGLYFQWGDTQGYTASQAGTDKVFNWANYKYGNGTSSPGATGMTKYNSTDSKTVLDASDDAAVANWGGSWRMPTAAEFGALGKAVSTVWTDNYQDSGVAGLVCTDKTDSSNILFFPAAGYANNNYVNNVGRLCDYWSSSLNGSNVNSAHRFTFLSTMSGVDANSSYDRLVGYSVRPVVG